MEEAERQSRARADELEAKLRSAPGEQHTTDLPVAMVPRAELERAISQHDAELAPLRLRIQELEEMLSAARDQEQQARADAGYLQTALAALSQRSDGHLEVTLLHEDVLAARGKESLARAQLARSERDREALREQLLRLEGELRDKDRAVDRLETAARAGERTALELRLQLERISKGHVEVWKAERWQRQLAHMRQRHSWLSSFVGRLESEALEMIERAHGAEERVDSLASVSQLLSASSHEQIRELSRLKDTLIRSRTSEKRLEREAALLRERFAFAERVQATLEERLQQLEAESAQVQTSLEADRDRSTTRANQMDAEVQRLAGELRAAKEESEGLRRALGDLQGEEGLGRRARRAAAARWGTPGSGPDVLLEEGDRAFLLEQVEKHRAVRVECEQLRSKASELRVQLDEKEVEVLRARAERDQARAERDLERASRLAAEGGSEAAELGLQGPGEALRQVHEAAQVEIGRLERLCKELGEDADRLRADKQQLRESALQEHKRFSSRIAELENKLSDMEAQKIAAYRRGQAQSMDGSSRIQKGSRFCLLLPLGMPWMR